MRKWWYASLLLWPALPVAGKEYHVPPGDVAAFFAELPGDATSVVFTEAAEYRSAEDIVLPDVPYLLIDGRGAKLVLGPRSNGFTRPVTDQKEAARKVSSRYAIQHFSAIEGGRKAIDLQATLNSTITDLRLVGQSEAAIDLRFCLMARVQNVLVTNPGNKGIVVRHGDWPGASASNSQSNSTVLEQCRVYAALTTTAAFTILNSGGVQLRDCISEGAPVDYDVFVSAVTNGDESARANNTVVKSFTVDNFHVEHNVRKASIYVNMPHQSSVMLRNVYWNGRFTAPVVLYAGGQLNIRDIGWFTPDFRIGTRVGNPRIHIRDCHSQLRVEQGGGTRSGVLQLIDPFPGHTALDLTRVVVASPAK